MPLTKHAHLCMNQRGIPLRLLDFALRHGRLEGDRRILDRQESRRIIESLTEELRLAKQVMDKGGITVVEAGGQIVTTYNVDVPFRHPKRHTGSIPTRTPFRS